MARGKSLESVLADAEQILRVWEANPTFSMGEVTLAVMRSKVEALRAAHTRRKDLDTELTAAINDANSKADELNGLAARSRAGIKATYGPDSTQYEQAGGTRLSERKSRKASKKPGTTS